jgi:hypothetical protein
MLSLSSAKNSARQGGGMHLIIPAFGKLRQVRKTTSSQGKLARLCLKI